MLYWCNNSKKENQKRQTAVFMEGILFLLSKLKKDFSYHPKLTMKGKSCRLRQGWGIQWQSTIPLSRRSSSCRWLINQQWQVSMLQKYTYHHIKQSWANLPISSRNRLPWQVTKMSIYSLYKAIFLPLRQILQTHSGPHKSLSTRTSLGTVDMKESSSHHHYIKWKSLLIPSVHLSLRRVCNTKELLRTKSNLEKLSIVGSLTIQTQQLS